MILAVTRVTGGRVTLLRDVTRLCVDSSWVRISMRRQNRNAHVDPDMQQDPRSPEIESECMSWDRELEEFSGPARRFP